jgi:selenocysteine lyase/cysteine desulfurase
MTPSPDPDAARLAPLRELLPATSAGIYLDTANAGPLPAETAAAMREADEWELRVGRAAAGRDEDLAQRAAEARAVLAALLGADPAHIRLAAGAELALIDVLWAIDWQAGQRLAIGPGLDRRLTGAARAFAARLSLECEVLDSLDGPLLAGTRLVVAPHVAADGGELLATADLGARLRAHGAQLAIDASLSAGAVPLAVDELGADAVFLAADRWLLGPEGTAASWQRRATQGRAVLPEAQLPRTTLLGLARSVGWLEMYVGLDWALERGRSLAAWLAAELAETDGVQLVTPPSAMATIVSFRLPPAWSVEEAADELGRRVFAIVGTDSGLSALRASVAWFNTQDELERFAQAVAELARHTPATLPRRPTLTVR